MLDNSESMVKQATPFSIESLLSSNSESKADMASLFRAKECSSPPPGPHQPLISPQFLFPQLVPHPHQVSPTSPLILRPANNNPEGVMPSNLPFDLLARSYMSNILGEIFSEKKSLE